MAGYPKHPYRGQLDQLDEDQRSTVWQALNLLADALVRYDDADTKARQYAGDSIKTREKLRSAAVTSRYAVVTRARQLTSVVCPNVKPRHSARATNNAR